ncbi:APA family basic amino acid/polyamine antiporter [Catalinimonas alkaloidigena]|uniref:APC family permease n=1 Tax=Catalinimonas alkaloidigena TaxID=1075417 RepID=UPI002406E2CF|nr:APC family permease [Catalinimonas alkaloidigena]MDF9800991.1 APA family basic amino acid/polyamine antiporter [Catalinimonas alkaloidigena]
MELKREIRRWDLVLLLINNIIGAGIFGLPSKIFALSGIYSVLALFVCGFIIFVLVLCFAEVASRFDKTGGPYLYTLNAFGKWPAFIIGWLILITRLATYAALLNLLVTYLSYFYPLFTESNTYRFGIIILATALLTLVNYLGVKNSTQLNNTLGVIKLVPLAIFIGTGLFFIDPAMVIAEQPLPSLSDFSSSIFVLVFAFTGFEATLVNTGEVRKPEKSIPFALITAITFIAIFYGLIQIVSIGTLPGLAASDKPLTDAAQIFMGPAGAVFISIGAIISISGTLNAVMLVGSRVPYALSVERQFPKFFAHLHPKFRTPTFSLLVFSLVSLFASLSGSFIYAVSISVISKILILLAVCAALIRLRLREKGATTFYQLPFGYFFASVGILACIWLLASANLEEFRDVLITTLVGIVLYGMYRFAAGRRKKV